MWRPHPRAYVQDRDRSEGVDGVVAELDNVKTDSKPVGRGLGLGRVSGAWWQEL